MASLYLGNFKLQQQLYIRKEVSLENSRQFKVTRYQQIFSLRRKIVKHSTLKIVSILLTALIIFGAVTVVSAQEEQTVTILYWQAVSILNPYLSGGTKDIDGSSLVLEPLANYNPDGILVPRLATDIPTLDNGGVSEDLRTITWNLRDDVVWSDGTPFTSADVVFTWEYCTNPDTGCASIQFFEGVESVEALDDFTVRITFDGPKPVPYGPFVTQQASILQQAQFANCVGAAAAECTEQNFAPIGTGPFMVEDFRPNDVVTYVRNPNYRDADEGKPFFDRVIFKGGGDAESAARAVLETGEADYAWNLQIAPEVLNAMEAAGNGEVIVAFATNVERLMLNQTNPDPDLPDDIRSIDPANNPHPFLTDPAVKRALSMAIDRNVIAGQLYGAGGRPACNIVNGPPANVSPNNDDCLVQDIEGANALLDEAGIIDTDGDGIREKDGVPLRILYQTSTNAVRQNTQALIKQWWSEIGVDTELRNIDAAVFFGGDPASPDTYQKFYADVEMFTSGTDGPDAETFLVRWLCGNDPSPENGWLGRNVPRHCNPEYDELFQQLTQTGDPAERSALTIQLNDLLIQDGTLIPLVHRGSVSARANSLEGVWINGWDSEMWNIADWTRAS
ncbi:MAG: peptide ABC transporter substrate-binding protein [Chloroflexi bacterium]|nr:MAG: peptide ABC transporter substrate-binding protein [Chloroflexota bacterium]